MAIKRLWIYQLLWVLIAVFLFTMGFSKYQEKKGAKENGEVVEVSIDRANCYGVGKPYIVFRRNGQKELLNVRPGFCESLQSGQTIQLVYSSKAGRYFVPEISYDDERFTMIGAVGMVIFLIGSIVWEKRKKRLAGKS